MSLPGLLIFLRIGWLVRLCCVGLAVKCCGRHVNHALRVPIGSDGRVADHLTAPSVPALVAPKATFIRAVVRPPSLVPLAVQICMALVIAPPAIAGTGFATPFPLRSAAPSVSRSAAPSVSTVTAVSPRWAAACASAVCSAMIPSLARV
eukprot:scaffold131299_cov28-Tisochrysis_lutea.AAC.1